MTDDASAEQETHARAAHQQEPLATVGPDLGLAEEDGGEEDEGFWEQVDRDVEHIRLKLSAWHPGWEDPEQEGRPFPLRYIAPDAAAYLAEHAHFTAGDMKYFASLTRIDFQAGDREDFFDSYLDKVEDEPWLAVAIDFIIAHHRVNASLSGRKKVLRGDSSRIGILLDRLPAGKLRLDSRPELADKLDQLANEVDVVDTDVAVAAFYQYAFERNFRLWPDLSPAERMALALDRLRDQLPETIGGGRDGVAGPERLPGLGAVGNGDTEKTERLETGDDSARGLRTTCLRAACLRATGRRMRRRRSKRSWPRSPTA